MSNQGRPYNGLHLVTYFILYVVEGLLQSTILESIGCIWFNRTELKDREIVAKK